MRFHALGGQHITVNSTADVSRRLNGGAAVLSALR
jgi:hypothetical protein